MPLVKLDPMGWGAPRRTWLTEPIGTRRQGGTNTVPVSPCGPVQPCPELRALDQGQQRVQPAISALQREEPMVPGGKGHDSNPRQLPRSTLLLRSCSLKREHGTRSTLPTEYHWVRVASWAGAGPALGLRGTFQLAQVQPGKPGVLLCCALLTP